MRKCEHRVGNFGRDNLNHRSTVRMGLSSAGYERVHTGCLLLAIYPILDRYKHISAL